MAGEGAGGGSSSRELQMRVLSALVLAAIALVSDWFGGVVFTLVWCLAFGLIGFEWFRILALHRQASLGWWAAGLLYAAAPCAAVLLLRASETHGLITILFLFAVVWGADVGAYFAGRGIGGPKLAPTVSPKKTWAGLFGGLLTAIVAGVLLLWAVGIAARPAHAGLAALLALASAMGDLFESWFKRKFGVKDSSHLIPGHGGFMDRLDGFIFAAVLAAMIGLARGGAGDVAGGLISGW